MVWLGRLAIKFIVTTSQIRFAKTFIQKVQNVRTVINWRKLYLRDVSPAFYAPGNRIIGCLDSLGWVIIRDV